MNDDLDDLEHVLKKALSSLGYRYRARQLHTMPDVARAFGDVLHLGPDIYVAEDEATLGGLLHEVGHALETHLAGTAAIMQHHGAHWITLDPSTQQPIVSNEDRASQCAVWLVNHLSKEPMTSEWLKSLREEQKEPPLISHSDARALTAWCASFRTSTDKKTRRMLQRMRPLPQVEAMPTFQMPIQRLRHDIVWEKTSGRPLPLHVDLPLECEKTALRNHSQTLERLRERHGVCLREAVALHDGKDLGWIMEPGDDHYARAIELGWM